MGDLVLVLVSIASLGSAATALGLAFRHHWQLLMHDLTRPPE
ncbi:hypothetical protein [Novosphingobium sp.]|jgi:hypothetical protein|nr:hypothetical protein [Novosphingobium sp.]